MNKTPQVDIPKSVREYFRKMGIKGAKQRAKSLTPEHRSEIARIAGSAPKSKRKKK